MPLYGNNPDPIPTIEKHGKSITEELKKSSCIAWLAIAIAFASLIIYL